LNDLLSIFVIVCKAKRQAQEPALVQVHELLKRDRRSALDVLNDFRFTLVLGIACRRAEQYRSTAIQTVIARHIRWYPSETPLLTCISQRHGKYFAATVALVGSRVDG
jgi:hypothetical protein